MSRLPNQKTRAKFSRHDEDRSLDLYLKAIGETPLLKGDEEVRLARRIKKGDKKALDKLTRANLRFVVSVAKQYQNQGLTLGDLINEGNIGLIKAAQRFDETRGFKFISYAVWWIRQAILQALAEQSRIVRLPLNRVGVLHKMGKASARLEQDLGREPSNEEIAEALNISQDEVDANTQIHSSHLSLDAPFSIGEDNALIDVLEDTMQPAADELLHKQDLRAIIEQILDTLTTREAEVITLYFGLNGPKAMTLEEIGRHFSLTRERVRQIKEKALRRLQHVTRSKQLRDFYDRDNTP